MSQLTNYQAKVAAHNFVGLMWHDLPADYTSTPQEAELFQFDLELWLACFAAKQHEQPLRGFELLKTVRKRAESYYQSTLKQKHHQPEDWAFFRFRLEVALLRTIHADKRAVEHCYVWHDLTAGFAHRISRQGADRPANPPQLNFTDMADNERKTYYAWYVAIGLLLFAIALKHSHDLQVIMPVLWGKH